MHLAALVVGHGVLLQAFHHALVFYHHLFVGTRFHYKLQDVEQLACVATAISENGASLLEHYLALAQFGVMGDCPLHEFHEVVVAKGLQHIELTAREQWADNLEGGVFGSGAYQSHHALLHSSEQGVLLALAETMDLVDEEYRVALVEESAATCFVYNLSHVFHTARHGAQRIERQLQRVCHDLRQCGLAHSGRAP